MKYVLFVLEERVKDLIETRLHDIRGDETAHKMRLRRLLPPLVEEFGEVTPGTIRPSPTQTAIEVSPVRHHAR